MDEARKKLLVVEDVFPARGGVHVLPRFTTADAKGGPRKVELRRPDGSVTVVDAVVEVAHMRGPLAAYAMLLLPRLTESDAPIGTEVWLPGNE